MKPVQIDFVAPRAWKFIWATTAVAVLAIMATTGVKVWHLRQQRMALDEQLAALKAQQLQREAQANAPEPVEGNPKAVSEAAAQRLLRWDWNRLYDAIETPALGKVRLVQLSMDAVTGQATLEYELESMAQVAAVTPALNAVSRQDGLWRLDRLENAAQGGAVGVGRVRGVWRAELK